MTVDLLLRLNIYQFVAGQNLHAIDGGHRCDFPILRSLDEAGCPLGLPTIH